MELGRGGAGPRDLCLIITEDAYGKTRYIKHYIGKLIFPIYIRLNINSDDMLI